MLQLFGLVEFFWAVPWSLDLASGRTNRIGIDSAGAPAARHEALLPHRQGLEARWTLEGEQQKTKS